MPRPPSPSISVAAHGETLLPSHYLLSRNRPNWNKGIWTASTRQLSLLLPNILPHSFVPSVFFLFISLIIFCHYKISARSPLSAPLAFSPAIVGRFNHDRSACTTPIHLLCPPSPSTPTLSSTTGIAVLLQHPCRTGGCLLPSRGSPTQMPTREYRERLQYPCFVVHPYIVGSMQWRRRPLCDGFYLRSLWSAPCRHP